MAGIEPEEILLAKLSKLFGGPEHVKTYEALKTDAEKIDFVYHSPIVTELFKFQSQALKKSNQELAGEGKSRVYKPTNLNAFRRISLYRQPPAKPVYNWQLLM
jgi:hypothetical protein